MGVEDYNSGDYPPFAVTADIAIFTIRDGHLCLLLVRRADDPYKGMLALPGGFVEINESADAAAERELMEETGISGSGYLEQLRTYSDPNRDPRMRVVTVAYFALIPEITPVTGSDAASVDVVPLDDIDRSELAFDHVDIIEDALHRLRSKFEYSTIATSLLNSEFTLDELREVYGIVWGTSPDPANFRRKVLSAGSFVEPTGEKTETGGRPASLYRTSTNGVGLIDPPIHRRKDRRKRR